MHLAAGTDLAEMYFRLKRFQNCCTPEPPLLSGIFLKKMPPFTTLKRARKFWNRSSSRPRALCPTAGRLSRHGPRD
jgi:hypothetical protein